MFERIACIGGATLDRQLRPLGDLRLGTSNPVRAEAWAGGAARNVAEALARLGRATSLFTCLGSETAADELVDGLGRLGVDTTGVSRSHEHGTAGYTAVLDRSGELVLGLAEMSLLDELEDRWLDGMTRRLGAHDLWVVDANLPQPALERLVTEAPRHVRIFADPVSVEKSRRLLPVLDRIDTIFPDRSEAAELAGIDPDSELVAPRAASRLRELGVKRAVVTLGSEGVCIEDPPRRGIVPAMPVEQVVNVSGAGDCFMAGLIFSLATGTPADPIVGGLAAASLSVESERPVPTGLGVVTLLNRAREFDV
jgi:pseudouridine kinase